MNVNTPDEIQHSVHRIRQSMFILANSDGFTAMTRLNGEHKNESYNDR